MNPSQGSFEALLAWLDPDPEVAAQKYRTIHTGLVRIFVSKGFSDAEDLADMTVDRVAQRLEDIRDTYEGEPAKYFHGVARFIMLEAWDRQEVPTDNMPEPSADVTNTSDEYECLLWCLRGLSPEDREFILDYHVYDRGGHEKIELHREMLQEQKVKADSTLRVRAYRIRARLAKCMNRRLDELKVKQNTLRPALSEKSDAVSGLKRER